VIFYKSIRQIQLYSYNPNSTTHTTKEVKMNSEYPHLFNIKKIITDNFLE